MSALIPRPGPDEFAPFYAGYISQLAGDVPADALRVQRDRVLRLLGGVPETRAGHRYEPGKWSLREVVGHVCDAERVFAYRLLRIARGDQTPLPGFDEQEYARAAGSDRRPWPELLGEWEAVRNATLALVLGLEPAVWERRGVANGLPVSARALFYILLGHVEHHVRVLHERYGVADTS